MNQVAVVCICIHTSSFGMNQKSPPYQLMVIRLQIQKSSTKMQLGIYCPLFITNFTERMLLQPCVCSSDIDYENMVLACLDFFLIKDNRKILKINNLKISTFQFELLYILTISSGSKLRQCISFLRNIILSCN